MEARVASFQQKMPVTSVWSSPMATPFLCGESNRRVSDGNNCLDRSLKFREIAGPCMLHQVFNDFLAEDRLGTVKLPGILRQEFIGDRENLRFLQRNGEFEA